MDVVIITPEPGRHKVVGQQLLALADDPRDVQWVTWPVAGYSIPMDLFSLFVVAEPEIAAQALRDLPEKKLEELANGGYVTQLPDIEDPPAFVEPKRRGRPRKETSTDNNIPEEE